MLNVHQLNVFIIAAETLNFTRTAKKLHLTQSSVSQHIKSLETQLDMDLFRRKGRALEITDAGKVLLPLAREIVEGSIRAAEQMELLKTEIHGQLIVGCNTAPGKYVLPVLLADFHRRHPLVKITCTVLPPHQTIDQLAKGEIHFALTNLDEESQSASEFQLFMKEPIELIVPKGHRWSDQGEIEPLDLYEECYIMREPGSGTYQYVKRGLTGVGIDIEKLNTILVMGTSESIALAVQQSLGIGFVSRMIVDKICNSSVDVVRVHDLEMSQDIYFGRQTVKSATSAQVAFWDFITSQYTYVYEQVMALN
jgi:DNA-binding transcriptional LysR family regulator